MEKRAGRRVPVGTIIFDPDGEYFWPDDKGRPGLCDVPALENQIVVFTPRQGPSPFYQSFVAGSIRLDIRRLRPGDVISIALPPERQDQQNVRKLRGLDSARWEQLVDLVHRDGNGADLAEIQGLLDLNNDQQAEALAARANMTHIVRMLHDPGSRLMDLLLAALRDGKLCVVDVSQLRGGPSLILSGLILRRIFDWNQEQFTQAESQSIQTIAVVEEAQSVLNETSSAAGPYIEWVKEGRKYDLGAVLITQQPGSIPVEILSQGDNWFIFHLLSAADLQNTRRANAHFSDDLLSSLLNEPIPGHGVFWSSVAGRPYPVPLRILFFEQMYPRRDPNYNSHAIQTYASRLRNRFEAEIREASPSLGPRSAAPGSSANPSSSSPGEESSEEEQIDVLRLHMDRAVEAMANDSEIRRSLLSDQGCPWGVVLGRVKEALPIDMRDDISRINRLVVDVATRVFGGPQDEAWKTEVRETRSGRTRFIMRAR